MILTILGWSILLCGFLAAFGFAVMAIPGSEFIGLLMMIGGFIVFAVPYYFWRRSVAKDIPQKKQQ